MHKRRIWGVLAAATILLLAACSREAQAPEPQELAAQAVAGQYIVVLNEQFAPGGHAANRARAAEIARGFGLQPSQAYGAALFGFAAEIPAGRLQALQRDPRVAFIEQDQVAHIAGQTVPTGIRRIFADTNSKLHINGSDDVRIDVDVAVLDTGIDLSHPDLNVVASVTCLAQGRNPFATPSCREGGNDVNGHGTHVAGTIAAIDNGIGVVGVAPGARLWNVQVLNDNGSGTISGIVAGIDYVTANASEIEVANMSLGCECSSAAMDTAIANSVAAGVVYAVAAGNSNKDAATFSPANHPDVITVSALADFDGKPGGLGSPTCREDTDDTLANFSNWGSLIDIAAPGVCILSTVPGGGYATYSGTSMASPHAAGAAAILASKNPPTNKTQALAIRQTLKDTGNFDWTFVSRGSGDFKEPLLDVSDEAVFSPKTVSGSGDGSGGGDDPSDPGDPPPPDGGFTLTATGTKVQGRWRADLSWTGTEAAQVDIYRNGALLVTVNNTGSYTDQTNFRGGGSLTYQVCEAGTNTCSNEVTVTF